MVKHRRLTIAALITVMGLVALLSLIVFAVPAAGQQAGDVQVQMTGAIASGGRSIAYNITLVNKGTAPVGDIYLAARVPSGSKFTDQKSPAGVNWVGVQGDNAVWLVPSVPASGKVGPINLMVSVTKTPPAAAWAWARWAKPSEGSASSTQVDWNAAVAAGAPKRGCTACHVVADKVTGKYSLLYEAIERTEVREAVEGEEHKAGGGHPMIDLKGNPLTFEGTGVDTCLQCHAPGKGAREGKGVIAPLALRDIVHPAHMNSEGFTKNYGGNCFTCHNVDGQGQFVLLGKKVHVNEKGIPEPDELPIPGQLPPSEGWR